MYLLQIPNNTRAVLASWDALEKRRKIKVDKVIKQMGESVSLGSTRKESIPLDLQNLQGGFTESKFIHSQPEFICMHWTYASFFPLVEKLLAQTENRTYCRGVIKYEIV